MQRLIWAVLTAFAMALVFGPLFIQWLKVRKAGQTIYEYAPEAHRSKQGVPTMGGFIFLIPALAATAIFAFSDGVSKTMLFVLASTVGFGAIGFVDDFIKVIKKRSLGLTVSQKFAPQILLSVLLAVFMYLTPEIGTSLRLPFSGGKELELGFWFIPISAFIMVATVNSANLLDGLDGLLGGCASINFAAMSLVTLLIAVAEPELSGSYHGVAVFCAAMTGALLGFLRYNSFPANVFMGDMGAFTIGGALAAVCIVTRLSLLLPMLALAMVLTSLSDLLQFAYFRLTHGKRLFLNSPLHNHLQQSGMAETRIVSIYRLGTLIVCLLVLLGYIA